LLVFRGKRRPQRLGGMAAARFLGEVWAVEVSAENARPAGVLLLQASANIEKRQVLFVSRHGRRGQQGRGAVPSVRPTDRAEGVVGAVHEIVPRAAVDVNVHEARREITAGQVDRRAVRGRSFRSGADMIDARIDDADRAGGQRPVGEQDRTVGEEQRFHGDVVQGLRALTAGPVPC
jgi:hypothetical protein